MNLDTFTPGKEISSFFNEDFDKLFSPFRPIRLWENETGPWPRVNVLESEGEYILRAEVPGMRDGDIQVEIHEGVLHLRHDARDKEEDAGVTYRIREFRPRNFHRKFRLGEQIDTEKVHAKLENGILTVTLSKKEAAKPRKIDIKVAA
ncbi:MAG: Hsp20/alpha crystallin family protein [Nitrospinaceae bacterium]